MKKITLVLLLILYTSPVFASATEDNLILPLGRQEYTPFVELNTKYYYTHSNYNEYFNSTSLSAESNTNSRSLMHYARQDLSIGYTMQHWLELELFLTGFWFAQSRSTQSGIRSLSILTNSIKTIRRVGIAMRSHQKWDRDSGGFIPEIYFSAPIYKINYNSSVPIVDDGSLHFTPSFWLYQKTLNILYPYIQLGVRLRPQPTSLFAIWKAGSMLKWNIFEWGVHCYGLWTMIKEHSNSELQRTNELLNRTNAGSLKFLSNDPGVIGFTSWVGLNLYNLSLRLSGDIDVFGKNYAKGYSAMLSIIFQIEPKRKIERLFNDNEQKFKIQPQGTPSTNISDDPLLEEPPEEAPFKDEELLPNEELSPDNENSEPAEEDYSN